MQLGLFVRTDAEPSDFLPACHPVSFLDIQPLVVCVRAQEFVIMFYDNKLSVSDESTAAIDHGTCRRRPHDLPASPGNIDSFALRR